ALIGLVEAAPPPDLAEQIRSAQDAAASGVPEVAVARLTALLRSSGETDSWRTVANALAPALIRAGQPREAVQLLNDSRWEKSSAWNFWRGQALAEVKQWNEAIACFQSAARGDHASD